MVCVTIFRQIGDLRGINFLWLGMLIVCYFLLLLMWESSEGKAAKAGRAAIALQ